MLGAFCVRIKLQFNRDIPEPSPIASINLGNNEFSSMVACDTLGYRKRFSKKSVKKTLTIPEWMNEAATRMGLNFSQILQDALERIIEAEKNVTL